MEEPVPRGREKPDPMRSAGQKASTRFGRLLQWLAAHNTYLKITLLVAFIVLTILEIRALYTIDFKTITAWLAQYPAAALLIFMAVFAFSVLLLLPTLPLNLLAGAFWGTIVGGIVTSFAAAISAMICLALARRFLGKDVARQLVGRNYDLVASEFARSEMIIVALFRLNPAFPAVMNYAFAFMPISATRFGLFSFLFGLPLGLAVSAAGEISSVAVLEGSVPGLVQWIIGGMAVVVSAVSLGWVLHLRRSRGGR
jgi:uncharacterized membrane protein YdjX (TVP38/TMEM64 family)